MSNRTLPNKHEYVSSPGRNVHQVDEGRTVTRTDQIQYVVHKLKMLDPPDKLSA